MRAALLLPVALLAFVPRDTRACACIPNTDAQVTPGPLQITPLDSHVFVTFPLDWRTAAICQSGKNSDCPPGDFFLVLRTATAFPPSIEAPFEAKSIKGKALEFLELTPKSLLTPLTRYELVRVDRNGKGAKTVIGTFKTGSSRDKVPPAWKGIKSVTVMPPTGGFISCGSDTRAMIFMTDVIDDSPIRFGVWLATGSTAIDYGKPPIGWMAPQAPGNAIELGSASCTDAVISLSTGTTYRVGVKPIDAAGNLGTSSEIDVVTPAAKKP